jgi:hypothetical protein
MAPLTPERTVERPGQPEQPSQNFDQSGAPAPPPMAAPLPVAPPAVPTTQPQDGSASASPAVAADDDLIEKEWVDRAKAVIAQTKHDPHLQEQAIGRLQADYLQKRYGKTIKLPGE